MYNPVYQDKPVYQVDCQVRSLGARIVRGAIRLKVRSRTIRCETKRPQNGRGPSRKRGKPILYGPCVTPRTTLLCGEVWEEVHTHQKAILASTAKTFLKSVEFPVIYASKPVYFIRRPSDFSLNQILFVSVFGRCTGRVCLGNCTLGRVSATSAQHGSGGAVPDPLHTASQARVFPMVI
jgi:hypothetical protein